MTCGPKNTYTISYTANEGYDFEEGDTRNGKDDARILELSDCEVKAFEGVHSPCKAVQVQACKLISKILSS